MPDYDKSPLTYEQQLDLLTNEREMTVQLRKQALHVLATVGYYRLSGYWTTLRRQNLAPGENERFIEGASFEEVYLRYQFDSSLRQISLYAINHIEVALRARLAYEVSHELHTGKWLQILDLFKDPYQQAALVKSIGERMSKSKEPFALHYKRKYKQRDPVPPAWIALQTSYFSDVVRLYSNLKSRPVRERIARHFGVPEIVFGSWLNTFWELRNRCAHHSPIWNRNLHNQPMWPNSLARQDDARWVSSWEMPTLEDASFQLHSRTIDNNRRAISLYAVLCCAQHIVDFINPKNTFRKRLQEILTNYTADVLWQEAGFTPGWHQEPLWTSIDS